MVTRRYGPPDTRTAGQRRADRDARYAAILRYLAALPLDRYGAIPNEIGERLRIDGFRVPATCGHSGKVLGPGSAISPTLQALRRRGLVAYARRDDGLSGTAYAITDKGRRTLAVVGRRLE